MLQLRDDRRRPHGRRVAHVCTVPMTATSLLMPQLLALRDAGHDVSVVCAPGPGTGDLLSNGIRFVPWSNVTRAWSLRADAQAFVQLLRILKRERFDVVHTHNPKPGVLGRIAARVVRTSLILNTVHGYFATRSDPVGKRSFVLGVEFLAARCGHIELFQSEEDLAWAREKHVVRRDSSLLLGNGVDIAAFPAPIDAEHAHVLRDSLGVPRDGILVLTIARLLREKGILDLVRAAEIVTEHDDRIYFAVAGPRELDKSGTLSQSEIDRAEKVLSLLGWRDDTSQLLAVSDVFALPSWREGVPRAAIEAAATGLPSVLTDIRGCREVVTHNQEGLLVPPRSPRELASAILELARDPALRARFGSAARRRAEERFDERQVVAKILAVTSLG